MAMKVYALLMDPVTETAVLWSADGYEDDGHAIYHWTEGNYGCDCNKAIFLGLERDVPCGEDLLLVMLYDEDGRVLVSQQGARR